MIEYIKDVEVTEEIAFEQDVRSMSYDELMATIRYLDEERNIIAKRVETRTIKTDHQIEKLKRVA